jgi:hypothetical protein
LNFFVYSSIKEQETNFNERRERERRGGGGTKFKLENVSIKNNQIITRG